MKKLWPLLFGFLISCHLAGFGMDEAYMNQCTDSCKYGVFRMSEYVCECFSGPDQKADETIERRTDSHDNTGGGYYRYH